MPTEICTTCANCCEQDTETLSKLKDLLPEGYQHLICKFCVTSGANEHFEATVRINLFSKDDVQKWKNSFQESSKVTLRIKQTYPALSTKIIYKVMYRCQHSTQPRSSTADARKGSKNTNCPATTFLTLYQTNICDSDGYKRKSRSSDKHRADYPALVQIKHCHNHTIIGASAIKHRDVSETAKLRLKQLMLQGYAPSAALEMYKYDLQLEHGDNYVDISADRAVCPDRDYVYRLYYKLVKEKYGEVRGKSQIPQQLKTQLAQREICTSVNTATKKYAVIDITPDEQVVVSICSPLMHKLSKTEGKAEKNLELSIEQCNRTNNPSFPVKLNGPVRRKKLKLSPMVPERDDDMPEISYQTIKVEENSEVDTASSISFEQGSQQYMVVAMDDLLKPYTVVHPAGSSSICPGPLSLQRKENNTTVRKQLQTWTTTGDHQSAEFQCTAEVKEEVSSDQEEGTMCIEQLETIAVEKEAATEQLSPRCCPRRGTTKRRRKSSSKAMLQQLNCELQSSSTQEDSQCSKIDIRDHHINMINPAFIKKEPEDFETPSNTEPVTQMSCHSSMIKTRTEMSKPRSEELPLLNMLHPDSVKKEPQDFEALWNVETVTPTSNQSLKTKSETEIYPTGIYHNVHYAKLRSGVLTTDAAKEVSCACDDSK